MENKFTPELIEKAKSAKTPEELMALAKENGMELTEESAKAYFEQLNPKTGELVWRTATVCPTMYAAVAAKGVLTLAPACCVVPDVLQATPAVGTV